MSKWPELLRGWVKTHKELQLKQISLHVDFAEQIAEALEQRELEDSELREKLFRQYSSAFDIMKRSLQKTLVITDRDVCELLKVLGGNKNV